MPLNHYLKQRRNEMLLKSLNSMVAYARFIRPVACVGSGDPVRVLRLYTTDTLDEV